MNYPVFTCGDSAVSIQVGSVISEDVNRQVVALVHLIEQNPISGITELVPSYTAVCVHYDPDQLSYEELIDYFNRLPEPAESEQAAATVRIIQVPVCYEGEYAPDLEQVALHAGLTPDEVVRIHCSGNYLVYMLGFLPGFAYMGGMDERIACPRLKSPREKIPAGSVGIAGSQTGIYPLSSPGGWQLIGRTPMKLFSLENGQSQFALAAGDRVRFVPITKAEFLSWGERHD